MGPLESILNESFRSKSVPRSERHVVHARKHMGSKTRSVMRY